MSRTITHFMWGYQEHFRFNIQMAMERLCQVINAQLDPHVFLVGIRVNTDGTRHAACIEPEQDHWAKSSQLYDVLQDVDAVLDTYPESQLLHSHPVAQANQSRWLYHRAVRDAVKSRLERIVSKPRDRALFITRGIERDGFLVMAVIEVDKEALAQIPAVDDDTIAIHEYRTYRVPRSILEAAIDVLGAEIASAILEPEAGAGIECFGSTDELLRKAGLQLFAGLVRRIDRDAIYAGTAEMLYDSIAGLSLLPYESENAQGSLVFAQQGSAIGVNVLQLHKPVPFKSAKAVRKLLMMSGGSVALRCNVNAVLSLVDRGVGPVGHGVRTLDVEIIDRGQWRASMDGRDLMVVKDGHPRLPTLAVDQVRIKCDLRRLIPEMTEESADRLAAIAKSLANSEHGAILAIASDASAEAARLANDSLPVVPLPLSPEMAANLSRIDGAILCDDRGFLHAIGVILDGRAVDTGDRGRGSRYNSSLRYALSGGGRAVLVISEDGGLDLLPTLRPTLSNSLLHAKINELKAIALADGAMSRREKESAVIEWLEKHSFYLDQAQCDQVNDLIRVCDERWKGQPGVSFWIERGKLHPSDDFQAQRDLLP